MPPHIDQHGEATSLSTGGRRLESLGMACSVLGHRNTMATVGLALASHQQSQLISIVCHLCTSQLQVIDLLNVTALRGQQPITGC